MTTPSSFWQRNGRWAPLVVIALVTLILALRLPADVAGLGHGWSNAPIRLADGLGSAWRVRPSLITLWLAATHALAIPLWLALVLKNLLFAVAITAALGRLTDPARSGWAIALVLLIPYVGLQGLALSPEQGWLTPALLVLVLLLFAPGPSPPAVFLASATLLLLSHVTAPLLALLALTLFWQRQPVAKAVAGGLLLGIAIHIAGHLVEGKPPRLGSEIDGWNLVKGNNPSVSRVYPQHSLDTLNSEVSQWVDDYGSEPSDFSEADRRFREAAWQQIVDHPVRTLRLALLKARVLFVDIHNPDAVPGTSRWRWLETASLIAMRVVLLGALAIALWRLRRDPDAQILLACAIGLALPYLIGFAYPRHAVPLLPVCGVYLVIAGAGRAGRWPSARRRQRPHPRP